MTKTQDTTLTVSGQITGMKHADAQNQFPITQIRPIKIDGKYLMVTDDHRDDRVNVEVQDDLITAVVSLD